MKGQQKMLMLLEVSQVNQGNIIIYIRTHIMRDGGMMQIFAMKINKMSSNLQNRLLIINSGHLPDRIKHHNLPHQHLPSLPLKILLMPC
ncbi:hypothetical protein F8388_011684 [Cannabis sativa]|uniref:Uncharacterized protein n=1 Tax=Cannabis sativa TaxID=3483 RepID=A0A7J6GX51_CANSA|nr:hypothetical protein F8388_011684 [Cannabis sativa]